MKMTAMTTPGTDSTSVWGDSSTKFFFGLTPEHVLEAVEVSGLRCTGRCAVLNSFENRVYEVEIEHEEGQNEARK